MVTDKRRDELREWQANAPQEVKTLWAKLKGLDRHATRAEYMRIADRLIELAEIPDRGRGNQSRGEASYKLHLRTESRI